MFIFGDWNATNDASKTKSTENDEIPCAIPDVTHANNLCTHFHTAFRVGLSKECYVTSFHERQHVVMSYIHALPFSTNKGKLLSQL